VTPRPGRLHPPRSCPIGRDGEVAVRRTAAWASSSYNQAVVSGCKRQPQPADGHPKTRADKRSFRPLLAQGDSTSRAENGGASGWPVTCPESWRRPPGLPVPGGPGLADQVFDASTDPDPGRCGHQPPCRPGVGAYRARASVAGNSHQRASASEFRLCPPSPRVAPHAQIGRHPVRRETATTLAALLMGAADRRALIADPLSPPTAGHTNPGRKLPWAARAGHILISAAASRWGWPPPRPSWRQLLAFYGLALFVRRAASKAAAVSDGPAPRLRAGCGPCRPDQGAGADHDSLRLPPELAHCLPIPRMYFSWAVVFNYPILGEGAPPGGPLGRGGPQTSRRFSYIHAEGYPGRRNETTDRSPGSIPGCRWFDRDARKRLRTSVALQCQEAKARDAPAESRVARRPATCTPSCSMSLLPFALR